MVVKSKTKNRSGTGKADAAKKLSGRNQSEGAIQEQGLPGLFMKELRKALVRAGLRDAKVESVVRIVENNIRNNKAVTLDLKGKAKKAVGIVVNKMVGIAVEHFQSAEKLNSDYKNKAAEAEYLKALDALPNFAVAHAGFGNALFHQCKYAEAEAELKKAIELDYHLVQAHNDLGAVYMNQGRMEEAEEALNTATELKKCVGSSKLQ